MPTPAGHSLAALAARAWTEPLSLRTLWSPWMWLALVSANAADLDFLPGAVLGNEALFHRGGSHSLFGAVLFGAGMCVLTAALTRSRSTALRAFLLATGLYAGHLLLDFFGRDPGPPFGIQVFWPFSTEYFPAPLEIFPHLDRRPLDLSIFRRAVPVVAAETALLGPVVAAAAWMRRRRERLLEQGPAKR